MADEPTLFAQTIELGKLLKTVSDRDPEGAPGPAATQAFKSWLAAAGPTSREPRYFDDISQNYDIDANSNKDLFKVFELLHPYIEVEMDEEEDDDPPPGTFIGLPLAR